jgi:hypothetical protein
MKFEDAVMIAAKLHKGQLDKQGRPYILHCMAVAAQMDTEFERTVAVLHDVLEDTDTDVKNMWFVGVNRDVLDVVSILTRQPEESYEDYIRRVRLNPTARKVKLADLAHNMDITRGPIPMSLMNRYTWAWMVLAFDDISQVTTSTFPCIDSETDKLVSQEVPPAMEPDMYP